MNCVEEIAKLKMEYNLPITDKKRETEVYERVRKKCRYYDIDEEVGIAIFRTLIDYSKRIQKNMLAREKDRDYEVYASELKERRL